MSETLGAQFIKAIIAHGSTAALNDLAMSTFWIRRTAKSDSYLHSAKNTFADTETCPLLKHCFKQGTHFLFAAEIMFSITLTRFE